MSGPSASLSDALQRLYRRTAHGLKPGLEATERLFDALHLSRSPCPIVHIAGTNGKGSTAAMLSAMLHRAGYNVGRFTSPHLVRFNERFTLNEASISDADLMAVVERVEAAARAEDAKHPDRPLTFFELSTAIALDWFAGQGADVAVIETGLGGRLDSTSVLQPVLSVITRIDLDHSEWLGETLAEIALEKAGILKPGIPLVLSAQPDEARAVLLREAGRLHCPVYPADQVQVTGGLSHDEAVQISSPNDDYGRVRPALPGRFQYENMAAAVTAAECLIDAGFDRLDRAAIRRGLEQVVWPGRAEVLSDEPLTLLDCAHNPGGMTAFLEWARRRAGKKPMGMVFSACGDKDISAMAAVVARTCTQIWVCELDSPRTASIEDLMKIFKHQGLDVQSGSFADVRQAANAWQEETGGVLCIAGSAYLAGMVLSPARDPGEVF